MQDTNSLIRHGKICPYCNAPTEFVSSTVVYGKDYGMMYLCRPCHAYVGVHEGTDKAKGRLANAELREWRIKAHASFDKIWQQNLHTGIAKHKLRNGAYKWLSEELGMEKRHMHIAMFDEELCKQLIAICDNPDKVEKYFREFKLSAIGQGSEQG